MVPLVATRILPIDPASAEKKGTRRRSTEGEWKMIRARIGQLGAECRQRRLHSARSLAQRGKGAGSADSIHSGVPRLDLVLVLLV